MLRPKLLLGLIITCFICRPGTGHAQTPGAISIDLFKQKPTEYEDKMLPAEKTDEKKFGPLRKFVQNNTSHFNFYYNANNKLNAVVERATISNKDDYTKLLPFYPYSLDNTSSQKSDLDSVIYKATAGILLHDLRTEWVDNFYLLIGKAYYLKKDFDSAALTFQYINYNLYPRKKGDDGYGRVVGTNENSSGTGSVSIADKEKRNFLQKAFTLPPSRNDALIWQIRTFIKQGELSDAAGLISILQNDKNLPTRLKNDLEEVTSYWFYEQNIYDSSANHLAKALTNADTKEDKSRWEYLLAQMYEMSGKFDEASKYYVKASRHTANPILDIYARLSDAKMMRNSGNYKELDNSIANLLKMAKRDRYEAFRDVIYYSAGQLSIQKPDTTNGIINYNKSIVYNVNSSPYRDKSYLQLANIAYSQRRYRDAHAFYDSLNISGNETDFDPKVISERKEILGRLVPLLTEVEREDSLQRIAAMSPAEREAFIKKLVKKYRKENGLKDEDDFAGQTLITFANNKSEPVDLFKSAAANTGEWYFYSSSLKSKGFNDFRSKWGKRSNVDNWRRKTASEATIGKNLNGNIDIDAKPIGNDGKGDRAVPKVDEYSFESMLANVPVSKEMIDSSNGNIAKNLYAAAKIFQNELEDYDRAILTYENYVKRFPNDPKLSDIYYNLAYCYSKIPDEIKASYYRNLVKTQFAGSDEAKKIANPNAFIPNQKNPEVNARYEGIYNMFIEGNFEQAVAAKKKADSTYGSSYWSPQLLYIEAVYYIKQHQDSNAIVSLKNIQQLYPKSPLKDKATTLIDVLGRRAAIEKYLTDLQVTRAEEEKIILSDDKAAVTASTSPAPIQPKVIAPAIPTKVIADSIKTPEVYKLKSFTLQPDKPHYVVMILDKVDGTYVNEAKNAFERFNKENMATVNVTVKKDALDAQYALLMFSKFDNASEALKYFDRIKRAAPNEVSWLQPSKYSFIIISDNNLELLRTNKDISSYKQLLNNNFGNKF